MEIDEFISRIRPLDLLVFYSGDLISVAVAKVQAKVTGADVSHVGIAINRKACPALQVLDDDMYIWESTISGILNDGVFNAETGRVTFGVQIRKLRDLIIAYSAKKTSNIGHAALIRPVTLTLQLRQKMCALYERYNGQKYDLNPVNLLSAAFPSLRGVRKALNAVGIGGSGWLFCSEFVTQVYMELGIIRCALNPKNILPADLLSLSDVVRLPPVWLSYTPTKQPRQRARHRARKNGTASDRAHQCEREPTQAV